MAPTTITSLLIALCVGGVVSVEKITPNKFCASLDKCFRDFEGHLACEDIGENAYQCICRRGSYFVEGKGCFFNNTEIGPECAFDDDCRLPGSKCINQRCDCPADCLYLDKGCMKKPKLGQECKSDQDCAPEKNVFCHSGECKCLETQLFYQEACHNYTSIAKKLCKEEGDCGNSEFCEKKDGQDFGICLLTEKPLGGSCETDRECGPNVCTDSKCACRLSSVTGKCILFKECEVSGDCNPKEFCLHNVCLCRRGFVKILDQCVRASKGIGSMCWSSVDCRVGDCKKDGDEQWGVCSCEDDEMFYKGKCSVPLNTTIATRASTLREKEVEEEEPTTYEIFELMVSLSLIFLGVPTIFIGIFLFWRSSRGFNPVSRNDFD